MGASKQFLGSFLPSSPLLMVLSLLVKMVQGVMGSCWFTLRRLTHFEFLLALLVLAMSMWDGDIVYYTSLAWQALRILKKSTPVVNNKDSAGAYGGNDVDAIPKYSSIGENASVVVIKVCCTTGSPETTRCTAPALVLAYQNFVTTSGGGSEYRKKIKNKRRRTRIRRFPTPMTMILYWFMNSPDTRALLSPL